MSGKGTRTWDWLWFLDLLAEWLLLSPQASQSSHRHNGNNDTVYLKCGLLCTDSSLQLYVLCPQILPLRVANIWKTIWAEHVRVCQLSARHLQFSLYWSLPRYDLKHTGAYSYVCLYTSTCTWIVQGTWASSDWTILQWVGSGNSLPPRTREKCV